MSDACQTAVCLESTATPYSTVSMQLTGASVNLTFGDSTTGTFASGPVVVDNVTLAGLSMPKQPLAAVNNTDNDAVLNGGAGIIGLGFPSQRFVAVCLGSRIVSDILYISARYKSPS